MISFNNLGNLGRLANQMFQYASLKGIARNRGYDYAIPPREVFGRVDANVRNSDGILYDVFELECVNKVDFIQQKQMISEGSFEFNEDLFNNCPDNVDLHGYFQSEKYFKHIEDEIRSDFTFKEDLLKLCKSFITEDTISLHIRRGDYVHNPNHPVQPMSYYEQALAELPELPVIVFSDDSEWCKEQQLFSDDRFIVAEGNSTDCDLCLMSLCKYHIIANSSYSWWGAWLANSKKVIAPKNWFGGDCANKGAEDMSFGNFEFI
tara:strand:- start:13 stop:801 length:789 start_codon:yes stop_codon:yes gene_type:complete